LQVILKKSAITVWASAALAALLIVAIASLAFAARHFGYSVTEFSRLSWRVIAGPRHRALTNVIFQRTSERLDRGRYLTEGILGCFRCHSDRNWSELGAPPNQSRKGAGHVNPDDMLARAIREGVGHDGRALHPQMWYGPFHFLSDEDVASVVVYIRALPAIRNPLPKSRISFGRRLRFADNPEPLYSSQSVPHPDLTSFMYSANHYARYADYLRLPPMPWLDAANTWYR
jgi:hypothetical protein